LKCEIVIDHIRMRDFRLWLYAFLYLCLFLLLFGAAIGIDRGSSYLSDAWAVLFWSGVLLGSLLFYARLWAFRRNPDAARHIEARGIFGLLPAKLRDWIFP
jgi:hypothetical protein